MRKVVGSILAVAVVTAVATAAAAQPWQGWKNCGGWCRENGGGPEGRGGGGRMYDPARAETMKGEVVTVEQLSPAGGRGQGIGLKLKTGAGMLSVHLGPQWYIERQGDIKISAGDLVEVKGVKAVRRGENIVIAGEVMKGGDSLKLRDDQGYPMWAGWRRSGPQQ